MSDLDTQIRDYARWLADAADAAAVHCDVPTPEAPASAGRRRWRRTGVLLAAAAVVVLLVVGLATIVRAPSDEAPADKPPPLPTSSLEPDEATLVTLADGYRLAVVGEPVVADGVEVWQGAPAPTLDGAIDDVVAASAVAALLQARTPAEVVLPDDFPVDGVERAVTVGAIGGGVVVAHAATQTQADADRDVRCVLVARDEAPEDWLSGCGLASPDGTVLGLAGGIGGWILWTDLPADAALVELHGTDGTSIYQYPIARTVAFPTRLLNASPLQLVAYDTDGTAISQVTAPGATDSQTPESALPTLNMDPNTGFTLEPGERALMPIRIHCGINVLEAPVNGLVWQTFDESAGFDWIPHEWPTDPISPDGPLIVKAQLSPDGAILTLSLNGRDVEYQSTGIEHRPDQNCE